MVQLDQLEMTAVLFHLRLDFMWSTIGCLYWSKLTLNICVLDFISVVQFALTQSTRCFEIDIFLGVELCTLVRAEFSIVACFCLNANTWCIIISGLTCCWQFLEYIRLSRIPHQSFVAPLNYEDLLLLLHVFLDIGSDSQSKRTLLQSEYCAIQTFLQKLNLFLSII